MPCTILRLDSDYWGMGTGFGGRYRDFLGFPYQLLIQQQYLNRNNIGLLEVQAREQDYKLFSYQMRQFFYSFSQKLIFLFINYHTIILILAIQYIENVVKCFVYYILMSEEIVANNTVITTVEQSSQNGGIFGLSYPMLTIIVAIMLMLVAVKLSKSKRKPKNIIALIGQRNSGKTQLFISLNQGKVLKTVPSIHNNRTIYSLHSRPYQMIDYIGDNISKEQVLQSLPQVHTIVHVIDGTDEKTFSDAAMFIYKVLVSKEYQRERGNYVVFLNKKDAGGYLGRAKIEHKLEDQIEHIKQARINLGEENENQDDYIKLSKDRFKLPFKIVEGSAESNVKDLQMTLDNL